MIKEMVPDLTTATCEVFETMVGQPLRQEPPIAGETQLPHSNVVASVGIAGSVSGVVAIHSTSDTADVIAAGLLGVEPDEVDGEMADAFGEVANMVAGSFRTQLRYASRSPRSSCSTGFGSPRLSNKPPCGNECRLRSVSCPHSST